MKIKLTCTLFALCFMACTVVAQQPVPADATAFYQKAITGINPKHIAWVKSTAANPANTQLNEAGIRKLAINYSNGLNLATADIDALVTILMMQIAKNEEQELRNQMEEMKKRNEEKKKMREAMDQMNKNKTAMSRATLDSFHLLAAPSKTTAVNVNPKITNQKLMANPPKANAATQASASEINAVQNELKAKADSMNEMSEITSMKLQMQMDRRSKMIEALSNIMKKIASTQDSIIQNLK